MEYKGLNLEYILNGDTDMKNLLNVLNEYGYNNEDIYNYDYVPTEDDEEENDEWADYERDMAEQMEEENRLHEYWKQYIKGRTPEMLDIGNDICMMGYDIYQTLPAEEKAGCVFDKRYDDIYINAYWEKNPLWSIDHLKDCYELANHWSFYSDWHKDVYGYRPRSL